MRDKSPPTQEDVEAFLGGRRIHKRRHAGKELVIFKLESKCLLGAPDESPLPTPLHVRMIKLPATCSFSINPGSDLSSKRSWKALEISRSVVYGHLVS